MATDRNLTPEEIEEFEQRTAKFRAMLERRQQIDTRLRAEREAREQQQHGS